MSWLADKRITVTGGGGFLGRHVVGKLQDIGCRDIFVPLITDYDLTRMDDVVRMYEDARPAVVIHLAAKVGKSGRIKERPGEFFYDNIMMDIQLMEQGRLHGVEKSVGIVTAYSYPADVPLPCREEDLWRGYPDESSAPYGLAKKMSIVQAQAYRQQYRFNAISLVLPNLYGPGDHFDSARSHVIPALIRRCVEAIEKGCEAIGVWGTGNARREFLYVEDAAEAIVLATERYNGAEPINVGTGTEVSISELVDVIVRLTGFRGRVLWDPSKPVGQSRCSLDSSKAKREFDFEAKTSLEVGLRNTIQWYLDQRHHAKPPRRVRRRAR